MFLFGALLIVIGCTLSFFGVIDLGKIIAIISLGFFITLNVLVNFIIDEINDQTSNIMIIKNKILRGQLDLASIVLKRIKENKG